MGTAPNNSHLRSLHIELLAIALALAMQKKWVEYPFVAMTANAHTIAKDLL